MNSAVVELSRHQGTYYSNVVGTLEKESSAVGTEYAASLCAGQKVRPRTHPFLFSHKVKLHYQVVGPRAALGARGFLSVFPFSPLLFSCHGTSRLRVTVIQMVLTCSNY